MKDCNLSEFHFTTFRKRFALEPFLDSAASCWSKCGKSICISNLMTAWLIKGAEQNFRAIHNRELAIFYWWRFASAEHSHLLWSKHEKCLPAKSTINYCTFMNRRIFWQWFYTKAFKPFTHQKSCLLFFQFFLVIFRLLLNKYLFKCSYRMIVGSEGHLLLTKQKCWLFYLLVKHIRKGSESRTF